MSRSFQVKSIPSSWIEQGEYRLDCGPYMSGALEAKTRLDRLTTESLSEVTDGMFHAGRESRQWVDSPEFGIQFLGSTDILDSDITHLPYISKKQIASNPKFSIHKGWTLITRSGTVGRMAYARDDMDGMACSEHVLRVIPDESKIKPGYLYAFLSSRFGVPIIVSGTYGAIIQHIEPHQLIDLPVPRLGDIEEKVHELVQQAADLRTTAATLMKEATDKLNGLLNFPDKLANSHRVFSYSITESAKISKRMDATYHDAIAQQSDALVSKSQTSSTLLELDVSVGETGRLKQVFVDEAYGVPFLTSGDIFLQTFSPDRYLSRRLLPNSDDWGIAEGDILLARSGQVGGIIGRGVWADKRFVDAAASVDVLRIRSNDENILRGYLFAYLCLTDVGYRQLIRSVAGSSIPHISSNDVLQLRVPRCECQFEKEINDIVWLSGNMRAEAQEKEEAAKTIVEQAIEKGAN